MFSPQSSAAEVWWSWCNWKCLRHNWCDLLWCSLLCFVSNPSPTRLVFFSIDLVVLLLSFIVRWLLFPKTQEVKIKCFVLPLANISCCCTLNLSTWCNVIDDRSSKVALRSYMELKCNDGMMTMMILRH